MKVKGFFRIEVKRCLGAYTVLTKPEPGNLIVDKNGKVLDMFLDRDGSNLHEVQSRNWRTPSCTGRITFETEENTKIFNVIQGMEYCIQ